MEALIPTGLLGDHDGAMRFLSDPYGRSEKAGREPFYLYRPVPDPKAVKDPAAVIVISEPGIYRGGAVFGYLDGHAEWIASPRADELLAAVRTRR